ncbi:MAG: pyridoxamine 5'-phosphate oxidase family protein [Minisyncoccia bacterium]
MDEKKIRDDVVRFLKENSVIVVATSYKDNPKVSPVYFVSDDDLNFYFATKRKTEKYIDASLNSRVAFVVGVGPEHISVQGHGRIEMVVNEGERERIVGLLTGKQNLLGIIKRPIDELVGLRESYKVVFKIVPDEMYFMNLDSRKHSETISDELIKII